MYRTPVCHLLFPPASLCCLYPPFLITLFALTVEWLVPLPLHYSFIGTSCSSSQFDPMERLSRSLAAVVQRFSAACLRIPSCGLAGKAGQGASRVRSRLLSSLSSAGLQGRTGILIAQSNGDTNCTRDVNIGRGGIARVAERKVEERDLKELELGFGQRKW